jgi:hypothetical protein
MIFLHISSLEPIPDALSQNRVLTQPLPISSKFEGLNRGSFWIFGYNDTNPPRHIRYFIYTMDILEKSSI